MDLFPRRSVVTAALVSTLAVLAAAAPARAGANPTIQLLQQTPLSLFTYGLEQLNQSVQGSFTTANPPPFAMFIAPLSGKIADIVTVLYNGDADTITLNVVKIAHLTGATPDDACGQAMTALRTFAGLDPVTGQLQGGMESSLLATAFLPTGTTVKNPAADYLATLDKSFTLSFKGFGDKPFRCDAPLFGTGYTIAK